MEKSYVRPANLASAVKVFSPNLTIPIYGYYVEPSSMEGKTILDLQDCGLNSITIDQNTLQIGASASMQSVFEHDACPPALKTAIKMEDQLNRRNMITLIDAIINCDGSSPVVSVLLAMDAKLNIAGGESVSLADHLPFRDARLFTAVELSIACLTSFKSVNATPADRPLVCAALTKWESGRVRLVLGGTGNAPLMVVDGKGSQGIEKAAASAYHDAGDYKASKEYRSAMARILTLRCLSELENVI